MTTDTLPPPPPSGRQLLTTVEVAEILRVSTVTVRRLRQHGEIDAVPGLRTLRFSSVALNAFLNRKK